MEKPEIGEFLNGNGWLINMTRTKKEKVSNLLGSTCDLEACLQWNYSVDDGYCGCLPISLELECRETWIEMRFKDPFTWITESRWL
jgi:hypothetical protein